MIKKFIFRLSIFLFLSSTAVFLSSTFMAYASEKEDESVKEKAHKRHYPGGLDEEDLQVKSVLPLPEVKTNAKAIQAQVLKIKINLEDDSQEE